MAYAIAREIRMPSVAMPKVRWPRLSQRTRALLMMGIMVSPCFLSDGIDYCVQSVSHTSDEIAERRAPPTIFTNINIFHVACPIRSYQRRSRRAGFRMLLYMARDALIRDLMIKACAYLQARREVGSKETRKNA